ncbi:DNA mismatch repair protein MutS [Paenibacillus popilliae]|uniref:DNA mismatch repair protein MutS n=1 Tax=Paenibacillus popilliae ATCC 14706 TaxID=1212764 RepID=M9L782_PAEPP|nr:DNA mismatch repair protein MutS [Paenibacillus popilliae]GAC40747.1 mismatch repair ATPase [Paenibacillus popilliae ATCC 14706]
MAKMTPMMEQYWAIKQQAEDAILFFRLGDFYEMFNDDAIVAAKELEITLTGRGSSGTEDRIPMCGVPYHSADSYIQRLIEKGYRVAICEQMEDPSAVKGVVRREIVRIITPGTIMEGKMIDEKANHYLLCMTEHEGMYAMAACDLSTGEVTVTSAPAGQSWLLDELNVYAPTEILGAERVLDEARPVTKAWSKPVLFTPWTKGDEALAQRQFGEAAWMRLEPERRQALALLMSYLAETQKRSLSQLTQVRTYEPDQYLVLDPFTRRNLELTETVRERAKKGSLLWLLDRTQTSMGGRLLRRWIDKPLMSKRAIEARLEAVDTLYHQMIWREDIREQLHQVYDLERLVSRIAFGTANGRDLIALKQSLKRVPGLKRCCEETDSATLRERVSVLDDCQDIVAWIDRAIVEEPPVSVRDGGIIKAGYDAYLDKLQEASVNGKQWIAELERREREETGIKSLKVGYNKVFGYYIEVTRSNLQALPEGRYERKQTLANAERFITAELKEKEALILEAEDKMIELEYDLFSQLRQRIGEQIRRLQTLAEVIAEIDVYQSLAAVSTAHRFVRPEITDGYDMLIEAGRHPVVEAVMESGSFMANDTVLEEQDAGMLLITGPNMAGKSTYMRQVALMSILTQMGSFVPADRAVMPIVDRIFTRIGAADDLIGGQSTFMVEMMDIQVMTAKATRQSLVIIDELGRGTSTSEGMSIAQAVIEFVHDQIGCKALVSTHFHELAHLEERLNGLRNVCMAVQESGNQVTFLRKLIPGAASTSYGIYCAKLAGLPDSIIRRSYDLLQTYETVETEALRETTAETTPADAGSTLPDRPALPDRERDQAEPPALAMEGLDRGGAAEPMPVLEAASAASGAVEQLSLFGWEQSAAAANPAVKAEQRRNRQADELIAELREIDVLSLTPLEAMNALHAFMKQARGLKND